MLKSGDRIGIVCCSNGQKRSNEGQIKRLEAILQNMGLQVSFSDCIYEKENAFSGTAEERARALMKFYEEEEIKGIFDISGGDLANGILPYLDYDVIADSGKLFWGYSDLTTVINAIYARTGKPSVLYQIRNLLYGSIEDKESMKRKGSMGERSSVEGKGSIEERHSMEERRSRGGKCFQEGECRETEAHLGENQIEVFRNTVMNGGDALFRIKCRFLQHNKMQGIVVGGNIRCFLKLAGTEFMPDLEGKILLLESYHGTVPQIETYLRQLHQLGAFEKAAGVLLGTFTQMDAEKCIPTVETLLRETAGKELPIAVTADIGHGTDSRGIMIGEAFCLESGN